MAMRKMDSKRFDKDIAAADSVLIDSSILIYHLEDIEPYSELTETLFTRLGEGRLRFIVSMVSVTELMAKPCADGDLKKVNLFRSYLQSIPNSDLITIDFDIALLAASLRGRLGLRTPDALLVATGKIMKSKIFITNDMRLRRVADKDFQVILLDEYAL